MTHRSEAIESIYLAKPIITIEILLTPYVLRLFLIKTGQYSPYSMK
jgi:hypothetical protein